MKRKGEYLYLVRYIDCLRNEEDFIVYKSNSISALFNEIIDLIGNDCPLLGIERIFVTDLDVVEV